MIFNRICKTIGYANTARLGFGIVGFLVAGLPGLLVAPFMFGGGGGGGKDAPAPPPPPPPPAPAPTEDAEEVRAKAEAERRRAAAARGLASTDVTNQALVGGISTDMNPTPTLLGGAEKNPGLEK